MLFKITSLFNQIKMSFRLSNNNHNNRLKLMKRSDKPVIQVNYWFGRLGNSIIQLINALHVALGLNTNVLIPRHDYFKTQQIIVNKDQYWGTNLICDIFFYQDIKFKDYFCKNFEEVRKKIKDIFIIDTDSLEYDENENNLVIHIRGGDIITKSYNDYILPPISYYDHIISSKDWENITIISEDHNWIVDLLLKKYPKISFKTQSLNEDIIAIIKSKNIVSSVGTFVTTLVLLANNKKNVYKIANLKFQNLDAYYPHNYIYYNLDDYLQSAGQWKNYHHQIEMVKNYKIKS